MPNYCFICSKCYGRKELVLAMKDTDKLQTCDCGYLMRRDFHAERVSDGDREYRRPIHSDALAIMPHQVAEHKKQFPNIRLDSECRPVFDSYRAHDAYLKKCGVVKHRQKTRRRGKKIATARAT